MHWLEQCHNYTKGKLRSAIFTSWPSTKIKIENSNYSYSFAILSNYFSIEQSSSSARCLWKDSIVSFVFLTENKNWSSSDLLNEDTLDGYKLLTYTLFPDFLKKASPFLTSLVYCCKNSDTNLIFSLLSTNTSFHLDIHRIKSLPLSFQNFIYITWSRPFQVKFPSNIPK